MNKINSTYRSVRVTNLKSMLLASVGAAAFSLVSVNASAQTLPVQQRVDFGDLDLSKPKDTQRLYRRLRTASDEVCKSFDGTSTRIRAKKRECMNQALTNAVEAIGHPSLTALHAVRGDIKLAQSAASSKTPST